MFWLLEPYWFIVDYDMRNPAIQKDQWYIKNYRKENI